MQNPETLSAEVATEAIVVLDIVESTTTNNLFGWYSVGRGVFRDLRLLIGKVCEPHGLSCIKSTGDGYLVTFSNSQSAEMAAVHAVEAVFSLFALTAQRNQGVSEERALSLRAAIHLGEVDVVSNDREGPHVSYTFRLEGITRNSLPQALNPIDPDRLPLRNYLLCSEEVQGILQRRSTKWSQTLVGLFKLRGFAGWREVFLVEPPA